MSVAGIITRSGKLLSTKEAIRIAHDEGHVDRYPFLILESMLKSYRPSGPTASMVAGGAWRRCVLENLIEHYIDPKGSVALTRGTLVHGGVELIRTDRAVLREERLTAALPNYSEVVVSGQIDNYVVARNRLEDVKTARRIPEHMPDYHAFQLATYSWLLRWNGYPVETAAILYISWDSIFYVDTIMYEGEPIPVIQHPLFKYEALFEGDYYLGWDVINRGLTEHIVPSTQNCNLNWCRYCPVKFACDRIDVNGEQIIPGNYDQKEYYD